MESWTDGYNDFLHFGDDGLLIEPDSGVVRFDGKSFFLTGSLVFSVPLNRTDLFPVEFSRHPMGELMWLKDYEIQYGTCYAYMKAEYIGFKGQGRSGQIMSEYSYSLSMGEGQEPIETNPNFTTFAGTPANPKNGALFVDAEGRPTKDNTKGVFKEFRIMATDGKNHNEFAGIQNFMDANNILWNVSYTTTRRPHNVDNVSQLSRIHTPEGPYPNISPRNWRYVGQAYDAKMTANGIGGFDGVFTVRKSWQGSGPKGWNKIIYG